MIFAWSSLPFEAVLGSNALNRRLHGRQAAYAGVVVDKLYQGSGSALQPMSRWMRWTLQLSRTPRTDMQPHHSSATERPTL